MSSVGSLLLVCTVPDSLCGEQEQGAYIRRDTSAKGALASSDADTFAGHSSAPHLASTGEQVRFELSCPDAAAGLLLLSRQLRLTSRVPALRRVLRTRTSCHQWTRQRARPSMQRTRTRHC